MSAPWVTPSAGREMTCLEPYLANGGGRPQPPDPTKHVLHPLILTSTLVQVLSVQNSCGHTLLSTYKRSSCSWASPPNMPLRSLSSVPASGTSIATKQQRAILQTPFCPEALRPRLPTLLFLAVSSARAVFVESENLAICPLAPSETRTFPPWLQLKTRHKCSCLLWGAWTWLFPEHLSPHFF